MADEADEGGHELGDREARPGDAREPQSRASSLEPDGQREPVAGERLVCTDKGEVPEALRKRYFTESAGRTIDFYPEYNAPKPAFRDAGARLTTAGSNPNTIRDMVLIAEHRGWQAIKVQGVEDFRREAWFEASSRGLKVRGFAPNERDLQELARRTATREQGGARSRRASHAPQAAPSESPRPRIDYEVGVRGRLVEIGESPFRDRADAAATPFVRIQPEEGPTIQIWGVTLPTAISRSGAKLGDEITLRREGVERLANKGGENWRRNQWVIDAERLREGGPQDVARDADLRAAQATLAVVSSVARQRLDEDAAERVIQGARAKAADHLEAGRGFREPVAAERSQALDAAAEVERSTPGKGPERVRRR